MHHATALANPVLPPFPPGSRVLDMEGVEMEYLDEAALPRGGKTR